MVLLKSNDSLKIGEKIPSFVLKGTDGNLYSESSFKEKILLVIFMCNHCPYVLAKWDYINRLASYFKGKVAVIGINPNDAENYPEDSFGKMKETKHIFYYLYDETQEVAKSFKAVCTPDPFVFVNRKLVYHGRLDDAPSPELKVGVEEMTILLEELLSSKEISIKQMPSMGCSIKWK